VVAGEGDRTTLVQHRPVRGQVHVPCLARLRVGLRPGPLVSHQPAEALGVDLHALLVRDLQGQVDREAVRVVQLKRLGAGDRPTARRPAFGDGGVQDRGTGPQRGQEGVLLRVRVVGDPAEVRCQLRVRRGHAVAGHRQQFGHRPLLPAQQPDRADRPAHDAAQHVAPPLVTRRHPVTDQHQGGTDVVGDDPQPDVVRVRLAGDVTGVRAVPFTGELGGPVQDRPYLIDLVEVVHALEDRRHSLQAHAGVDVLRRQVTEDRVVLLAGARAPFELHEDEVPELQVAVLVNRRAALQAVLGPAIVEQLGTGSARAGDAHRPEVVGLAATHDPVRRDADRPPDLVRLVVVEVDRRPDPLRVKPETPGVNRLGGQVPGERDRLVLEVVPEREVAVHLEERAVPAGLADLVDVRRTEALLHADGPLVGGRLLPQEVGDELHHAGGDEQEVRVADGGQRSGRHHGVTVRLEVREVPPPDLRRLHRWCSSGKVSRSPVYGCSRRSATLSSNASPRAKAS